MTDVSNDLPAEGLTVDVTLVHTEAKIGDSLCALPLISQVAEAFGATVRVRGAFSSLVRPLAGNMPIAFEHAMGADPLFDFHVGVQLAYDRGNAANEHMATSMCRLAGVNLPALPASLNLVSERTSWRPGIAIGPFSGSRNPWYKLWPIERWVEVARRLTGRDDGLPVYAVGGHDDDYAAFVQAGVVPLAGLPLTEVLSVLRQARVFLSIDNGLSHLAHFGGVDRHVLLYPEILASNLVRNPRGLAVTGMPGNISVEDVLAAAETVLDGDRAARRT